MLKIKFNWGTGILMVIILFFLAVVGFFIYMSNLDINLVEDNYYERELVYQERIDHMRNAEALPDQLRVVLEKGNIALFFPRMVVEKATAGKIHFYRPSDPGKDFTIPIQVNDSAIQKIPTGRLDPGKWTLKIDWVTEGTGYYVEKGVYFEH
jgi:nitrogen fixation protein FixH